MLGWSGRMDRGRPQDGGGKGGRDTIGAWEVDIGAWEVE